MSESRYAVDASAYHTLCIAAECAHYAIYASYGGQYPYLVAYADLTVQAFVPHECARLDIGQCAFRLCRIFVFQLAIQIGMHVMHMHPLTGQYVACGMTNRIAVLNDVFTPSNRTQCHFVPGGYVLCGTALTAFKRMKCHSDVINGVNYE